MASGSGRTREAISLTQRSIDALRPAEMAYRVPDQRCIGLAVRVAPSGIKTWDLAYRIRNSGSTPARHWAGFLTSAWKRLANAPTNSPAQPARVVIRLREEEKRAAQASRLTIEQLVGLYVGAESPVVGGRPRKLRAIEAGPMLVFQRRVDGIRRRNVRELLDPVADKGNEREAEKRRQTIGAMFRWALSQDIVETGATAGLTAYDPGTPRDGVLAVDEIEVLWKWLKSDALPSEPADILKLELLIGARCGEISGLCAEEINREEWLWTLPAERSKNKKPRVTPLVGGAKQIIQTRLSIVQAGPLFRTQMGTMLTAAHVGHYLLARRDKLPIIKFTTHDLRRTVATQLTEMGIALDLVAAVIGHEAGSRETRTLVRHYVRTDLLDRKRSCLEAWQRRLSEIIEGKSVRGNVTQLADTRAA